VRKGNESPTAARRPSHRSRWPPLPRHVTRHVGDARPPLCPCVCLCACLCCAHAMCVVYVCRVRAYTDAIGGRHTKAALAAVCGLGRHGHGTSADGTAVMQTKHTCHATYTCHTP
jgi:hypothetical protein